MGTTYLIEKNGINRQNGKAAATSHGSVLAGYILNLDRGEPAGKFVSFDSITGLVPARGSYSSACLEARLAKYGQMDPVRFHEVIVKSGGRSGGEVGTGARAGSFSCCLRYRYSWSFIGEMRSFLIFPRL